MALAGCSQSVFWRLKGGGSPRTPQGDFKVKTFNNNMKVLFAFLSLASRLGVHDTTHTMLRKIESKSEVRIALPSPETERRETWANIKQGRSSFSFLFLNMSLSFIKICIYLNTRGVYYYYEGNGK